MLEWLRVLLDGHLPRLLIEREVPPALLRLHTAVKAKVGVSTAAAAPLA